MPDKKTANKEMLLKHTNEGTDQLSTLQEEFDALLQEKEHASTTEGGSQYSDKVHQASITEIDDKLSSLNASEFTIDNPSAAELAKSIKATFGDHTIIIVGNNTVINEESKSDKAMNASEDHPSKPKENSKKPAQDVMDADAPRQQKTPDSGSSSTVIKPSAFARKISAAEMAAFEAVKHGKKEAEAISDTPANSSESTHSSKKSSPLTDPEIFSSMQKDLDAFEHETPAAESFPEWEPDADAESMADQTTERVTDKAPSAHRASDLEIPESKTDRAEEFPEWEPMPADSGAESMPKETSAPPLASRPYVPEPEMFDAIYTKSKTAWFTEPLIKIRRKVRALYSGYSVSGIFHKLRRWKPTIPEFFTDTSTDNAAEQTSETAQEVAATRSPREIWGSILFIVFSLAAISLVLWQIVEPIVNEVKVTTHKPDNIERPQLTAQTQAVTAKQPDQVVGEPLSDVNAAKPGEGQLTAASDTATEILEPETASAAKPPAKAAEPVSAAVKETKQVLPAPSSKPPAAVEETIVDAQPESIASASPALTPDTVSSNEYWAVALSAVDAEKTAIQQQARLRATGIEAEYIRTIKNGKAWFFIQIGGFGNKQAAEKQGNMLAETLNTQVSWIDKQKTNPE